MDLHLSGHVAVVVGGARGIGFAIAKEFANEGCRVGIVDISGDVMGEAARAGGGPKEFALSASGPM
jgi:NAD(P)-dependent dehydrogenase (short-subunit alcohol dehydrogenase family)